ncbi:MAG: HmuY family protein [Bacteroidota bacterium]
MRIPLPRLLASFCFCALLTLAACDSADPMNDPGPDDPGPIDPPPPPPPPDDDPVPVPLPVVTVSDVAADPAMGGGGPGSGTGRFTLYDLDENEVVLSWAEEDQAVRDAAINSPTWDIGFQSTTIIFNGGDSGPGMGTAQVLEDLFADVTEAPANGYAADGANADCSTGFAVCTGSDNGWYNYNFMTNIVSPLPGRTIVMTTGEGDYAKVRVMSYYQGAPTDPDPFSDPSRYYTFEYVLQPDGSRNLETTIPDDEG